ncbi:hypothetical protein [Treponema sp. C6A8]|uniref:LpxL/LpxP family acyltransferase n=1 Tax=Treponema sp. C6A8 TaxID=1410609 RepID=UPI000AF7CA66|nr:hypothetical protein [Treponema sp. C6A8]
MTNRTTSSSPTASWKNIHEVSKSGRSLAFTAFLVRIFPHRVLVALTRFVSLFYWAFTKWARNYSSLYQRNLIEFSKNLPLELKDADISKLPARPNTYRHITSFATSLVEKIEGWTGKTGMDFIEFANGKVGNTGLVANNEEVKSLLKSKKGCMLICSHLGNIELFRSILSFGENFDHQIPVSIIMDQKVTQNFNNLIENLNANAKMNVIASDDISMATIGIMQDTIDQGGLVIISADRLAATNTSRSLEVNFLGKPAKIPYGPFLIAALLNCPTFFIFSMRKQQEGFDPTYVVNLIKSKITFDCSRKEREEKIRELANDYIKIMEVFCLMYPYQWYNFFDFW